MGQDLPDSGLGPALIERNYVSLGHPEPPFIANQRGLTVVENLSDIPSLNLFVEIF